MTRPIAFAALVSTTRAKVGSAMDWAWDYFGHVGGEQILDRPTGQAFTWGEEDEPQRTA